MLCGLMFHCNRSATESHILCVSIQQSVIKEHMLSKARMEGNVNGHYFTIEGTGEGKPYK